MAALGKLDQRLVRFNTDCGSAIPDAMVAKGQMLTTPATFPMLWFLLMISVSSFFMKSVNKGLFRAFYERRIVNFMRHTYSLNTI